MACGEESLEKLPTTARSVVFSRLSGDKPSLYSQRVKTVKAGQLQGHGKIFGQVGCAAPRITALVATSGVSCHYQCCRVLHQRKLFLYFRQQQYLAPRSAGDFVAAQLSTLLEKQRSRVI